MNKLANKLLKGSLLVLGFISLQGCITTAVVTSAAVATKVATDPRTTGTQVDDEILEEKVAYNINKDEQIKQEARINVVALQRQSVINRASTKYGRSGKCEKPRCWGGGRDGNLQRNPPRRKNRLWTDYTRQLDYHPSEIQTVSK